MQDRLIGGFLSIMYIFEEFYFIDLHLYKTFPSIYPMESQAEKEPS